MSIETDQRHTFEPSGVQANWKKQHEVSIARAKAINPAYEVRDEESKLNKASSSHLMRTTGMQVEFLEMQREQYDEHEGPGNNPDPERVWNGDEFAFGRGAPRSAPRSAGALLMPLPVQRLTYSRAFYP